MKDYSDDDQHQRTRDYGFKEDELMSSRWGLMKSDLKWPLEN